MKLILIVGQYKSGTSWLLSALCAHPQVLGLREVDVARAAYGASEVGPYLLDQDERCEYLFERNAWSQRNVTPALEGTAEWEQVEIDASLPLDIRALDLETVRSLHASVAAAATLSEIGDAFVAANATVARSGETHLVIKAANQIEFVEEIRNWRPDARLVCIVRDGRDAAISASHYRKVVSDRPWYGGERSYDALLTEWAERATASMEHAKRGNLYLLRYEDLTDDFAGTFTRLLDWLDLDNTSAVVDDIRQRTSFEARTGRPRGTEGAGVIRKGAVGEWMDELADEANEHAWELIGAELEALGYRRAASHGPLPAPLAHRAALLVRSGAARMSLIAGGTA